MGSVSMLVRVLPDKILSVLIILAISVGWAGQGYAQVSGARGIGIGPNGGPGPSTLCSNPQGADPSRPCSTQTLSSFLASQTKIKNPNPDPTTGIDQAVLKYLPFFHLPNAGPIGNGDMGLFTFVMQQVVSENHFTTRVDQKISEKDSLFGP